MSPSLGGATLSSSCRKCSLHPGSALTMAILTTSKLPVQCLFYCCAPSPPPPPPESSFTNTEQTNQSKTSIHTKHLKLSACKLNQNWLNWSTILVTVDVFHSCRLKLTTEEHGNYRKKSSSQPKVTNPSPLCHSGTTYSQPYHYMHFTLTLIHSLYTFYPPSHSRKY